MTIDLTYLYVAGTAFVFGVLCGLPLYRYLQKRYPEKLEALAKQTKALGERA